MDNSSGDWARQSRTRNSDVLPRDRLFGLLDHLRDHPFVWIGGEPGAGKSALIASYVEKRKIPATWYHVCAQDSRPQTDVLRDLCKSLPHGGVLVLDDCHEIAPDALLHVHLVDCARQIPSDANVVLIGRGEPPGVYARLLANRILAVLDPRELRFTLDETRALASGVQMNELTLEILNAECGGWTAGVALTVDRLRRKGGGTQDDVRHEVRKTAFDYFAGEIFDGATPEERQVLVSTALVPRVSGHEAQQISGRSEARTFLNKLASRRLFTFSTTGTPSAYEYTPLFREFLLTRVEDTFAPNELRDIGPRASAILERCGEVDAAVALHVRNQDWESLLGVIFRHGMRLLAQGRESALHDWITAVPATVVSDSAWLGFWSGAAMASQSPAAARAVLENAWSGFEQSADAIGRLLTASAVLETYQLEWSSYELARRWIDRLQACVESGPAYPSNEVELRVLANLLFALTSVRPASNMAAACCVRLLTLIESDLDINHRLFAARSVLIAFSSRLEVESAGDLAGRMRSLLQEKACCPRMRASALNAIAYSLCLKGSASEADLTLQEANSGVGHLLTSKDPLHHLTRQLLASARRDRTGIADCIQALRRVTDPTCQLGMSMLSCALAQQETLRGELSAAVSHWLACVARADAACVRPMQWIARLGLSGCLAGRGDCDGAARALQEARTLVEVDPSEAWHRDCDLVAAYLTLRRGDRDGCHRLLRGAHVASAHVAAGSLVCVLLPFPMADLCAEALRSGIGVESFQVLIERYRLPPPAEADGEWPWPFKVFVLGRFRVLKGDSPIRFSRRAQKRPLELLQALIAFGGAEVSASVLTDALWPDSDGDAGYHALESALYRLRQLLGSPAAVVMAGGKLSLNRQVLWVDLWAFESALHTIASRGTEVPKQLARMRQLYAGHFLEQESEKPWALKRRQALWDKFVGAVRDVARIYESQGLWQEAANVYRYGIDVDSLCEDLHRGLIICHRELGDHAEALQAYRRCRELLVRVLGVQPNAKTLAIYQSVRQSVLEQAG